MTPERAIRTAGEPVEADDLERRLRDEGLSPRWWSNGPGDRYGWHQHAYHKVLFCSRGSVTFHLHDGDVVLNAGDRLDLGPETPHAATVGDHGVRCVEAPRDP